LDERNPKALKNAPALKKKKYRFFNLLAPGPLEFEFVKEALKGLRPFQYDLTIQKPSSEPRCISDQAMGVGLAVPDDSAACAKVLEFVQELEVKAVRVDITYGHDVLRIDELIDGLNKMNVGVLLHLIQPLEDAELMPDEDAVNSWRKFVEDSLDHFSSEIEAVEIGSTINRAKWTRYTLSGFLAAWQVGYAAARARDILIVGPNVTDFEPQYNAGVLGIFKNRGVLPDVHSNNHFAERAIQPENLDQKILGHKLKKLIKYDLRKKICLLGAIAKRNGLSRNWSTSAFWTLPRIDRFLAFSEEQKADYVARYFVLCFSQPATDRVYWGPLISAREGLIDDSTGIIPPCSDRDVVSIYSHFPGKPEEWRIRPAFYAFRAVQNHISGAQYCGARCWGKGLEIHEFTKDDQVFHVVWTVNGKLARLSDCYSDEDLKSLSALRSRDGDLYKERPDFFTQSAVYLFWEKGSAPKILETAEIVEDVIVAPSHSDVQYFDYQTSEWRGIIRAKSREEAQVLAEALAPKTISQNEELESLRKSRNAIWTVKDPRNPENYLAVKTPNRMAFHKKVFDRFKPSKALRSWNGTSELMRRGIETPKVVAYFESKDDAELMQNWFICERFTGNLSTRTFIEKYGVGETEVEGHTFESFSDQLIRYILDFHRRGVLFRDLSPGNILVKCTSAEILEFSLIDTARLRCRRRGLIVSERVADLKRLIWKLSPTLQEVFMEKYMDRLGKRFTFLHRLNFKLYSFKIALKRLKKRWKGKSG